MLDMLDSENYLINNIAFNILTTTIGHSCAEMIRVAFFLVVQGIHVDK